MSSSLFANIKLKSRFLWVGTMLTRVAMGFDGVSESSSGYNRPAVYGHGHEHEHEQGHGHGHGHEHEHEQGHRYDYGQDEGPEPSDADEGLADRG
jgi:hypothetical protein